LGVHPEVITVNKEAGEWTRLQVSALNPAANLRLAVAQIQHPEPGRTTFQLNVALPVRFQFERQLWKAGVRLYSGSVKGRLDLAATLQVESTAQLQMGSLLPALTFRVRVTAAQVSYDHFVLEHVAGFGGTPAAEVGKLVQKAVHQLAPSVERDLLAKANGALCKAADTKEVRVGLDGLRRSKK
jgi:hypothetical protein